MLTSLLLTLTLCGQLYSLDSVERAEPASKPPDGLFDWQLNKESSDAWNYKFRFNPDYCPFPICTIESTWSRLDYDYINAGLNPSYFEDAFDGEMGQVRGHPTSDSLKLWRPHPLERMHVRYPIKWGWVYTLTMRFQGWIARIPCERDSSEAGR
jgi:hypothetical protein